MLAKQEVEELKSRLGEPQLEERLDFSLHHLKAIKEALRRNDWEKSVLQSVNTAKDPEDALRVGVFSAIDNAALPILGTDEKN